MRTNNTVQQPASLLFAVLAMINVIIVRFGYVETANWYMLLLITVPLMIAARNPFTRKHE